jgi:hypothetical protein
MPEMMYPKGMHDKAYVCNHVFDRSRPILLVNRSGGDWCFLCGELHPQDASAYKVVGIGHVLESDASLRELYDLPADWEAERKKVGQAWTRTPAPSVG